jgi:phage antirepressor YoqD-like protein
MLRCFAFSISMDIPLVIFLPNTHTSEHFDISTMPKNKPKASYYDLILQNKSLVPISKIAKDYGMSGRAFNKLLHELGVQYKMGNCWLLYQEYADQGYTQSKTHAIDAERSVMHTYWTQKGRLFIYDLLKNKKGILPVIEREQKSA